MEKQTRPASMLETDGWLEFNQHKWGVKPLRVRLTEGEKALPAVEAVLYLDRRGQIVKPPLNPYLPVTFHPTPTDKIPRLHRQWGTVAELLAEEFARRGVRGSVALPPEVADVRQWQWKGFLAEVRYTFYLDLPYNLDLADHSERKQVKKGERSGLVCEMASEELLLEVMSCLTETEGRQGFSHGLTVDDLKMAIRLLGHSVFRVYVCRSGEGEVASARVVLSIPGSRAVDWVAGTKTEHLRSGASQFLLLHVLSDLAQQGASGFDFAGANLPSVSAAKADWGGRLVPYFVLRRIGVPTLAHFTYRALRARKQRDG